MRLVPRVLLQCLTILVISYVIFWFVERFRRRGPMPYNLRWVLDLPYRRFELPARTVLERSHIMAGRTVLEVGPGTGYFSVEAASMVGEKGSVLCLDVQRPMLGDLSARLRAAGVTNAHPVVAHASWLPLREGTLDSAFLASVLGEISDRPAAMVELKRALKPGGVLSVTEHLLDPDYQLEDSVRDLCRAVGLAPLDHHRRPFGYTMNFRAP